MKKQSPLDSGHWNQPLLVRLQRRILPKSCLPRREWLARPFLVPGDSFAQVVSLMVGRNDVVFVVFGRSGVILCSRPSLIGYDEIEGSEFCLSNGNSNEKDGALSTETLERFVGIRAKRSIRKQSV